MKKNDLRVLRTNKMIITAFIKLVGEKGFDAITIQDIADEAMINRATFYAHYKDKQDLYEQILNQLISTFTSIIDSENIIINKKLKVKNIERLLTRFYKRLKEDNYFSYAILDGASNEIIQKKFADTIRQKYTELFTTLRITENDIEVPIDFVIEYMTSIFTGTLRWWVTSNGEMKPCQMAALVIKLIGNGHLTVLGIEVER
ncbi:MAG: TetR/AcrR family transcriptional regulator [Lactobacillales bacterium]|nr:TetR/AcrR family transcriptional regulator [Lactobacillales bacterium]